MAKIYVSFNVVTVSDIIIVARELDNLLAEVWRSPVYTPPHGQRNFTIEDVNPVMHQVQVWSTVDGTTLAQLKNACDVDASLGTGTAFEMIQFVVDRGNTGAPTYDPVADDTQYVNPDLDGKDYAVFKPGFGPLVWDLHIEKISGGGFQFINGQVFAAEEEYTIMYSNLVQTRETEIVKGYPKEIVEITGDTVFGPEHYNRIMEVDGSGIVTVTVDNFNTIPDNTVFGFNTHGGTQKYVTLQLPVTFYAMINASERNAIHIGRGETVWFMKKAGYLRIVSWDGDYRRVGEVIKKGGTAPLNTVPRTGGWVLMADVIRLYEWYVTELPVDEIFTDLTETNPASDANKGLFGIGTTKIWIPDARGRFNRVVSGSRKAGSMEAAMVGPHWHGVGTQNNSAIPSFNRATAHSVRSWNATAQLDAAQLSSTDFNQDPLTPFAYSTENRPDNIGVNEYIII